MNQASYQDTKNCFSGKHYLVHLQTSLLSALQNLFISYQSSSPHFSYYSLQLLRKILLIFKQPCFQAFNTSLSDVSHDIFQHFDIGNQNNIENLSLCTRYDVEKLQKFIYKLTHTLVPAHHYLQIPTHQKPQNQEQTKPAPINFQHSPNQHIHTVQYPQCLGCIRIFYESIMINMQKMSKFKSKNFLFQNNKYFFNQQQLTQDLCALSNCGGGYLFVVGNDKIGDLSSGEGIVKGFQINSHQIDNYLLFVDKCKKYIEPMLKEEEIQVCFVPVLEGIGAQFQNKWVLRIHINPKEYKIMYYISYKIFESHKKQEAEFFDLSSKNQVIILDFDQVYNEIHYRHQISQSNCNMNGSVHENIKCFTPITRQQLRSQFPKISLQPEQIEDQTPTHSLSTLPPPPSFHKFKHTILIITGKQSKQTLTKINEFKAQLIKKKIVFNVDKIQINSKIKAWVVYYDCLSQIIQSIFKLFNRNGQLTCVRVRKAIKIIDDQFLLENKDKVMRETLEAVRGELGEPGKLEIEIFNTNEKKLDRSIKKPIFVRVRTLRDAILCYSILYAHLRRIQFVDMKQ